MRTRAAAAVLFFGLAPLPAAASLILEQEIPHVQGAGNTQFNDRPTSQVFTMGAGGELAAVEVFISRVGPLTGNLLFAVFEAESGEPPYLGTGYSYGFGTPLANATSPVSSIPSASGSMAPGPGWIRLTFPTPVAVSAGMQLALVLETDVGSVIGDGTIAWYGNDSVLPGSAGYFWRYPYWEQTETGSVLNFALRTYLVPEPGTLALMGLGLGLLARIRGCPGQGSNLHGREARRF